MSFTEASIIFVASLALCTISSAVMARRLDQATAWLRLPESLVGLITALGADAPEIASAVTGIMSGHHDLGLGVIFGSNIFNLAALLGIGAIVAGRIRIGRPGILLNGAVALWINGEIGAQAVGLLAPVLSLILAATALLPYIALLAVEPGRVLELPVPAGVAKWLCRAIGGAHEDSRAAEPPRKPSNIDLLALVPLIVMIVLASVGLVRSALVLGKHLGISRTAIGTLVLAPLTGLPNLVTAIALAKKGRGSAVVVETFNSNSINLLAGVLLPAIIVGLGKASGQSLLSLWWMIGMTAGAIAWSASRHGLRWPGGVALIVAYIAFATVIVMV
jgi:cation:H+ antiporter